MQQDIKNSSCKGNNGIHIGHAYVDLGLPSGIMWATCNIGASSPEEYGDYFAWGETEPKEDYTYETYKFDINEAFFKYNEIDNITELEDIDDAAHVNWGGNWRMPTTEEQDELREHCEWTWTDNYKGTEINGYIVKSKKNGNTIFLPAAGYRYDGHLDDAGSDGLYWSRSLSPGYASYAYYLGFTSSYVRTYYSSYRYYGLLVRAVCLPATE